MARLNDPPVPPTESIDALKRRFIRQNREIARVNSTQSQRIRNLESEISRLLAENIALREQAIAAAAEAERWHAASKIGKDVVNLKIRLESKLSEVNALVEELGSLSERSARRSSMRRRKSGFVQDLVSSPDQKDWRTRQTIGGVLATERDAQDGRLPAIVEDKYYPRRTLETEELRILTAAAMVEGDDTESPELGPPPVVHFEVAEPVAFDHAKSPPRVSGSLVADDEDVVQLPRNLETRRKRRTSSLLNDMSGLCDAEDEQPPLLKSNAKRKFDVSEMEVETPQPVQNDGFEFSRKESSANRPKPSRFTARPVDRLQKTQPEQQKTSPQKDLQPRKALAAKSTNSPTKRVLAAKGDKNDVSRPEESAYIKPTARRMPIPSRLRVEPPRPDHQVLDSTNVPKTPAPPLEDMMSPPASAIDTSPRHKSTEAAITNSVEDVLNGSIGRGSRRARSAVSYAEPNLRDKMRRPDKKLVGAVEGLSKPANASDRESSGRDVSREKSTDAGSSATAMRVIKVESEQNEAWKDLPLNETKDEPASPLQSKEGVKVVDMLRKKRTFSESEGTRSKQQPTDTVDDKSLEDKSLDDAVSRLSIYDHPTSSPTSGQTASTITKSRRHSVQSTNLLQGPTHTSALSSQAQAQAQASKLKRSTSASQVQVQNQLTSSSSTTRNGSRTAGSTEKTLGPRRRSMMV